MTRLSWPANSPCKPESPLKRGVLTKILGHVEGLLGRFCGYTLGRWNAILDVCISLKVHAELNCVAPSSKGLLIGIRG